MKKLVFLFIFCLSHYVSSQEVTKKLLLESSQLLEAIPEIETYYNIQFSYLDKLLSDKTVTLHLDDTTPLSSCLQLLQSQTKLKFEMISKQYIVIRKFTNKDTINICGYLLDSNKHPLQNAEVTTAHIKTGFRTDKKGFFEIQSIPYGAAITLSPIGKEVIQTNSKDFLQEDCLFFYFKENIAIFEALNEVIITDYLTKGITKKDNTININTSSIGTLPGLTEPDILQSIQQTPGVNSPFETASGLHIRGSTPSQNLVLWNGIKTYNQSHLFGMISSFNPYIVKEVNFIKSGTSAQYGDRLSGIIEIETDQEITDKFSGGAGVNMINADAYISLPLIKNKVSVQVSGRRSFTDIVSTPTYNQLAERVFQNTKILNTASPLSTTENNFYFTDYNASITGKLSDKNLFQFNSIYNKNDLEFTTYTLETNYSDILKTENEGYNFKWKQLWSKHFEIHVSGYYTKYRLDYQYITNNQADNTQTETKKNSIRDYGAALDLSHHIGKKNTLLGGYQYSKNNIQYAFETITPSYILTIDQNKNEIDTHAVYGEYSYDNPGNLTLSLGLRGNYYTGLDKQYIEPRFFLKKNISPYFSANISGEYRSQIVSQIEESVLSDLNLENQIWTLSNKEKVPPITSYQYTIGSTLKKNSWFLDLDTYFKKIDQITTLTSGFLNPVDNSFKLGNSTIFGLDIFLKKRFGNYNSWISYAYINAQNKFEDLNKGEPFPGNTIIEHTVKWSHFYTFNNFKFALGWWWHTGKSYTEITGIDAREPFISLAFDKINGKNLPVYHRLDFSLIYDFKLKQSSTINYRLGMSVLNIYNRKNLLNKEFRVNNALNSELINTELNSLGITPNLSLRIFW